MRKKKINKNCKNQNENLFLITNKPKKTRNIDMIYKQKEVYPVTTIEFINMARFTIQYNNFLSETNVESCCNNLLFCSTIKAKCQTIIHSIFGCQMEY